MLNIKKNLILQVGVIRFMKFWMQKTFSESSTPLGIAKHVDQFEFSVEKFFW